MNKLFLIQFAFLFLICKVKSQDDNTRKFLAFYNSQNLTNKVNVFDTLDGQAKLVCFPYLKEDLQKIKVLATKDNKGEILDKLVKIEGEMCFLNKNYSKAIPIYTDLLSKNKIKTSFDSAQALYILKNSYLNIRQLNKTVEIHKILVSLRKRNPKINIWLLSPRLSSIYYEMQLYNECLKEQLKEYEETKQTNSSLINFCNNRGIFWEKCKNQDSALFWFKKARAVFNLEYLNKKLSYDNEFTLGLIEGNIGQSLMELKEYEKAIPLLKLDIIGSKNIKNFHNAAISQLEISRCYMELNKFEYSKLYLDSANMLMSEIDDYKTILNIIKQYGIYYTKIGNYRLSSEYLNRYINLKDSIESKNNLKELMTAQVANQLIENESLIIENQKKINEKNTEVSSQKKIRNTLILSGIFLLGIIIFILIQLSKTKHQKQLLEIKNNRINTRNEIITNSLKEKDLLVKEVHHRVKNNLQIISSLLKLQAGKMNNIEIQNALSEAQERINSMSLIHQLLYRNNQMTSLLFNEYLSELTTQISSSFSISKRNIKIELKLIELELDIDTAIPLGLITTELLSNSYKHAFGDNPGNILIELSQLSANKYKLRISDNGKGLPENFDIKKIDSFGLDIVTILTEQINAELKIYNDKGAAFEVVFSKA